MNYLLISEGDSADQPQAPPLPPPPPKQPTPKPSIEYIEKSDD
jgi:hypothetical protein